VNAPLQHRLGGEQLRQQRIRLLLLRRLDYHGIFLGQTGPLATKPRPVQTPAAEAAEESGDDTLVLRASQPNAGVFATREGNWLRDLLAGEGSILASAE